MKMLMDIDPLPMRGSMVMTMVMISPSRRDVSLAEQLRWSPRLVPPRGGRVSSEKMAYDCFPSKTPYSRRWSPEGHQGAHEVGARPRGGRHHPCGKGVGSLVFIFGEDFLLFIVRYSMEFQVIPRTFVFCT